MLKRHIILTLLLLNVRLLMAQDNVDKVPLSFGVSKPQSGLSSNSGTLAVQVPLENLGMIPVALSYAATGIKVEQRAGVVGLGWDISTDAYITREVRGLPDDGTNGYRSVGDNISSSLNLTAVSNIRTQIWDSEPDVFRFRFFGFSGTFLIQPSGNVVNLSQDNIKIEPIYVYGQGYNEFLITDPSGNRYIFDIKENMSQKEGALTPFTYTYKWHLSNVDIYNDSNDINFDYFEGSTLSEYSSFISLSTEDDEVNAKFITSSWKPRYISSIVYGGYRINFDYGFRSDISGGRNLNTITFLEYPNNYAQYKFNYHYFSHDNSSRLMLKSIQKVNASEASTIAGFRYFGEGANEPRLPNYSSVKKDHWGFFNANEANTLFTHEGADRNPALDSARANSLHRMYVSDNGYEEYEYELHEYNDNGTNVKAGGLRIYKVKNSSGGIPEVTKTYNYNEGSTSTGQIYSLPQYSREWVLEHWLSPYRSGLVYNTNSYRPLNDIHGRSICYSKISITYPDQSNEQNYYYNFADDLLENNCYPDRFKIKVYHDQDHEDVSISGQDVLLDRNADTPYGKYNHYGSKVGLPKETRVYNINNDLVSKNIFEYQKFNSNTQLTGWNYLFYHASDKGSPETRFRYYYFAKYTIQPYFYRPSRTETIAYNPANSSHFKKSISEVIYHNKLLLPTRIEAYIEGQASNHMITENEYVYDIIMDCRVENNADDCLDQCDRDYYDGLGNCSGSHCEDLWNGIRENCYNECDGPFYTCLASKDVAKNMIKHNLVTQLKSSRQLKDNKILSIKENIYSNTDWGNVQLERTKSYLHNAVLASDQSFTYNANGKVISTIDNETNDTKAFILDEKERVIAEADNVNSNQIYYEGFEASGINGGYAKTGFRHHNGDFSVTWSKPTGNYTITYWYRESGVWKFMTKAYTGTMSLTEGTDIDEVRVFPEGSGMQTYAYHPNGQVKTKTDINNVSLSTDLDDLGRKIAIRDHGNNIIKSYSYNLKNVNLPDAEPSCSEAKTQCDTHCEEYYDIQIESCNGNQTCITQYEAMRVNCYNSCQNTFDSCVSQ